MRQFLYRFFLTIGVFTTWLAAVGATGDGAEWKVWLALALSGATIVWLDSRP